MIKYRNCNDKYCNCNDKYRNCNDKYRNCSYEYCKALICRPPPAQNFISRSDTVGVQKGRYWRPKIQFSLKVAKFAG